MRVSVTDVDLILFASLLDMNILGIRIIICF